MDEDEQGVVSPAPSEERANLATVGLLLRRKRAQLELSLWGVEAWTEGRLSHSVLSRIEAGKVRPTPPTIRRIAEAYELPYDALANAFGYASPAQQERGIQRLKQITGEPTDSNYWGDPGSPEWIGRVHTFQEETARKREDDSH